MFFLIFQLTYHFQFCFSVEVHIIQAFIDQGTVTIAQIMFSFASLNYSIIPHQFGSHLMTVEELMLTYSNAYMQ